MRLIILNQFFYPDHSATSQLMTELAESLVTRGLVVTALAGRGRYNGGDKLSPREEFKGVRIERAWATSFGKRSAVGRVLDYLSFYVGASWKLLLLPKHDIILALTTPPFIGLVALLIGRLRGMRIVSLVQDVYPDIAVALGALRAESLTTQILIRLNVQLLKRSHRIVVLSQCMRNQISAKLKGDDAHVDVIHNWADANDIKPLDIGEQNPFSFEHKVDSEFVILFSGNLGRVNEFTTVLEAARLLAYRKDIVFLFVGEGAAQPEIQEFCFRYQLSNVRLLPYQPRNTLRYSLAAGDALLVTLKNGLAGLSVPSKAYASLAAGRPLLFVGDSGSEIAQLIVENRCGKVIEAGNNQGLVEVIEQWASNRSQLKELGSAARSLFEERFDRPRAVNLYLETFTRCITLPQAPSESTQSHEATIKDTASY